MDKVLTRIYRIERNKDKLISDRGPEKYNKIYLRLKNELYNLLNKNG